MCSDKKCNCSNFVTEFYQYHNDGNRNITPTMQKYFLYKPSFPTECQQQNLKTLTKKHQCLAMKCRQPNDLFICYQVKLVKHGIVLGKVLVVVDLLLSTKPHAVYYTINTTAAVKLSDTN